MISILIPTAGRNKVLPCVPGVAREEYRTLDQLAGLIFIDNNTHEDLVLIEVQIDRAASSFCEEAC